MKLYSARYLIVERQIMNEFPYRVSELTKNTFHDVLNACVRFEYRRLVFEERFISSITTAILYRTASTYIT